MSVSGMNESAALRKMSTKALHTQFGEDLQTHTDGQKKILPCVRTNKIELKPSEKKDLHIFYWAAYYGLKKYVRLMLIKRRWSPFIKSYKNRSILAGAICGGRSKVCRMILKEYEYQAIVPANAPWVKKED